MNHFYLDLEGASVKTKLLGLLAGMISIGAVGAASAADMAVKAAPPPPPPLPSWTGFYLGGDIGGAWADSSGTTIFTDSAVGTPFVATNSLNRSGFIGGFYYGYNWQVANWVFGIEGDWSWTDRNGGSFCGVTTGGAAGCIDNGFGFVRVDANNDWIATLRGRLGYTFGSVMLYGTAGGAWVNNSATVTADCRVAGCGFSGIVAPGIFAATFDNTRTGWVAGLGLEWMVTPNWLIRGEWLHVDVGNSSGVLVIPTTTVGTTQTLAWSRDLTIDIARFGIAYKFDWGQARY
jgi:outer membrane immunogenic protein